MTFVAWWIRGVPAVLLCVSLNGCVPSGQSGLAEEREPHFLEGKSCVNSMDYKGAIEKFEQTLEVNPRHAKAHFELGCLYEEKEPDATAAIYHYEQYLKLRSDAENAEFIRQRITNCKQDLAKTVLLPITPGMQHQFDQLAEENKRLQTELERLKVYAARLQSQTNFASQTPVPVPGRTDPGLPQSQPTTPLTPIPDPTTGLGGPAPRTHTVQSRDSFYSIAKRYGVKLEALMAANSGQDPRRLRVGQALNIPSP